MFFISIRYLRYLSSNQPANSLTTDNNKGTLTFCMFYDSCMVTEGHFKFMMAVY